MNRIFLVFGFFLTQSKTKNSLILNIKGKQSLNLAG